MLRTQLVSLSQPLKKTLTLWRAQLLSMLPALTCFSADFGAKLLLIYLSKEHPKMARKVVKTRRSPVAVIYLWESLFSPLKVVAKKI